MEARRAATCKHHQPAGELENRKKQSPEWDKKTSTSKLVKWHTEPTICTKSRLLLLLEIPENAKHM